MEVIEILSYNTPMKSIETKEKFLILRAKGYSYNRLAKELKTSKTTLISWAKEMNIELKNAIQYEKDQIIEKYKMSQNHRMEKIFKLHQKLMNELEKRSFENIPTIKLIKMSLVLNNITNNIFTPVENLSEKNSLDFNMCQIESKEI